MAEVISGLTEGQKYIADGSFLLKSELEKDEAGMDINSDLPKPEGLFERIIQFSIQNAIWVLLFVCTWIAVGVYSYQNSRLMLYPILPIPKSRLILKPRVLLRLKSNN